MVYGIADGVGVVIFIGDSGIGIAIRDFGVETK